MQRLLWLFLLGGCPAPMHYVVADVTASRAPVHGALVAADCGHANAAQRTDEDGRARVQIKGDVHDCTLVVAKPGLPTVETGPVDVCPGPYVCRPTHVDLTPTFANPRRMEVAE